MWAVSSVLRDTVFSRRYGDRARVFCFFGAMTLVGTIISQATLPETKSVALQSYRQVAEDPVIVPPASV